MLVLSTNNTKDLKQREIHQLTMLTGKQLH